MQLKRKVFGPDWPLRLGYWLAAPLLTLTRMVRMPTPARIPLRIRLRL